MPRLLRPTFSLLVVSLLTGILWRLELHLRWGWASLDWIASFHWSFLAATVLYLAWMARRLMALPGRRNAVIIGATIGLALTAYFGGSAAMFRAYTRWFGFSFDWRAVVYALAPALLYLFVGAAYFALVQWLLQPSLLRLWTGALCYILAFPAAIMLLWVTAHRGGPDVVHAIKSGFVFPFITFAFGFPLAAHRTAGRPDHGGGTQSSADA